MYEEFYKTMKDIETYRNKQLDKINSLILPATVYYPNKVKGFRNNLGKILDLKKTVSKNDNDIKKAEQKGDQGKVSMLNSDKIKTQNETNVEIKKVENELATFEAERVTDNKYLLLHYIHSELSFHANSLEKLSILYGQIMCMDPKEKLPDFVTNYHLNSLKEIDLATKYEFRPGETERKLARLKNPQLANTNERGRGMVGMTTGVNPNPNAQSMSPTVRSAVNRIGEDPLLENMNLNNNTRSVTPVVKQGSYSNFVQGFQNSSTLNTNIKTVSGGLVSSQIK